MSKSSKQTDEPSASRKDRKQRVEYDPNGTVNVARTTETTLTEEDREKLLETHPAVRSIYHGGQAELATNRLETLQKDDEDPVLDKLSEKQRNALQRRRNNDQGVRKRLQHYENKRVQAAVAASDALDILQSDPTGYIQAENDMERTCGLTQVQLKHKYLADNPATAKQIYDLKLQYGPYGMEYDRSGRFALLYGKQSHVAIMDCLETSLVTEFTVQNDVVRDACFLHNGTMAAVAQKHNVFIYDNTGAEIHRLQDHVDPLALQFLPYHWLLASIGRTGWLVYQDTSTGEGVSKHRTMLGECSVLRQNPANAVLHAGHANGCVTLWSPANSKFLVKMLCHKGAPITALAVSQDGRTMVTGSASRQVKVWDLRMYKERHSYYTRGGIPTSLDISQRGIIGIGHGVHATFWNEGLDQKAADPYMQHLMPACGPVQTLRFRPFEDVCGIGHSKGIASIVIPGAGEPFIDTSEYNVNPNQDSKQRREQEVRALLDKLAPEMIGLDADRVGGIEESDPHKRLDRIRDLQETANENLKGSSKKEKTKKRGRSKIQTKLRRKRRNILDQNMLKLKESRAQELAAREAEHDQQNLLEETRKDKAPPALKRFLS